MAESTLTIGYPEFLAQVGYMLGFGRTAADWEIKKRATVDDIIASGLRQFYYPPPIGGRTHDWSFLKPTTSLSVLAEVTGTLAAIPQTIGEEFFLNATEAIFTSAMVGNHIQFDVSGYRFEITEYLLPTRVRALGIGVAEFGVAVSGVPSLIEATFLFTTITTAAATFYEDNHGDNFVVGVNSYPIVYQNNATTIVVSGDAASESGAFTVERGPLEVLSIGWNGSNTLITVPLGSVRSDMVGDTVYFVDGAQGYTITGVTPGVVSPDTITVAENLSEDVESVDDTVLLKKAGTILTSTGNTNTSTVTVATALFDATMQDMYLFFPDTDNSYQISEVVNEFKVNVDGNASQEAGGFTIYHVVGTLSGTPVYDGVHSTVTASSAVFTAAMDGLTMIFKTPPGRRYAIAQFNTATEVLVAGNASGELAGDDFYVAGPSAQASGDTFAIEETGEDYELPDDFGGFEGELTFATSEGWRPIRLVGEGQIRALRQRNYGANRPQYAAIQPIVSDGTSGQRSRLMIWPAPETGYTLSYRYNALPNALSDTNPFPLGGMVHGETILLSCLSVAEQRVADVKGVQWDRFMERLAASVIHDQRAITAEHLGYNRDGSDRVTSFSRRRNRVYYPVATYNGETF